MHAPILTGTALIEIAAAVREGQALSAAALEHGDQAREAHGNVLKD
jgi:ATP-binding cassette subfamily B (MDR/TAP) protein 1